MKMDLNLRKSILIIICLSSITISVHNLIHDAQPSTTEDLEYTKLYQQQRSLEDNINNLVQDMLNVQKNVSKSVNGSQKVVLLQQAITSERQKIFNIRNQVIPPFSLSKTACLQLTNQQKIDILQKIKSTKQQITSLQKDILSAPKCDKINSLQKDALKQLILLESLEKTIYTQCQQKSILTPTIYQTNVYADGWILGDQHIDDLVQQYYQRNIKYHNITNCPLQKPFFNGVECIMCKDPNPVFNILTRKCTSCPEDQQPDSNLRQCAWQPHYTNFSWVENWAQDGAPMPVPKRNLLPCPITKPYYNGKKCQVCLMPKYWSIQKNACVQCPPQTIFDTNDKKCQKPEKYDLTILQGTRWVTNDCNLTRIVEDRVKVLELNKTKKYYTMCPSSKPFYDGIVCINCPNQFNIDTRKCVSTPNKTASYNENVRCYVQKQTGFETDPRAFNYTTDIPLIDSSVPNCKKTRPFYDGIACINCLQPFPIFNAGTKRCTNCDPMQIFNKTLHKCIPRQKIYISTNENHLMATPNMSIDDYHAQIQKKIVDNPEAIVLLCRPDQYSNYKECLNCSKNQYFNVQTKKCQICDGTLDEQTKICKEKAYIYTNINQDSIQRIKAVPNTTTLQKQNATITQNLGKHVNSKLCSVDKPYFEGKICTNCTDQVFNYTSQKCAPLICDDPKYPYLNNVTKRCQECPKNMRYSATTKRCQPIVYVTNTNAIYFYIQEDNYTKANLEDQIFQLQANNSVTTCDASHPYWNGTNCIECAITRNKQDIQTFKPYFNLKSLKCQSCEHYDNQTHQCKDSCKYPTPILDPATNSCKPCPESTVWDSRTQKCQTCPPGQIYNDAVHECQTWVTNIDALKQNYLEQKQGTKPNLNNKIQQLKKTQKVNVCPPETPFFSPKQAKCIQCVDPLKYFNLYTETCQKCDNYDVDTHTCQQALPRFKMNVQDFYSTIFG